MTAGTEATLPFFQLGDQLRVQRRENGRDNVAMAWLGANLYVASMSPLGEPVHARVDQLDPITLQTVTTTGDLPVGPHRWPGSLIGHRNGSLYLLAGSQLFRISADCQVVATVELPEERPFHSLCVMPDDGQLVMKDVRLTGMGASRVVVVSADEMMILTESTVPEPSFGPMTVDGTDLYIPGDLSIFRFRYRRGGVTRDPAWTGRYRTIADQFGLASGVEVGGGAVWVHDNGDTEDRRFMLQSTPVGSVAPERLTLDSFVVPHRVHRFSLTDSSVHVAFSPFAVFDSWVCHPPVSVNGAIVTFDARNAGLMAYNSAGPERGPFAPRWHREDLTRMRPLVFPGGDFLLIDDLRLYDDDNVVVLDTRTGREVARVRTGSSVPCTSMMLGQHRDIYLYGPNQVLRIDVVAGPGWAPPSPTKVALLPPPGWL